MKSNQKKIFSDTVAAVILDKEGHILASQRALNSKLYPGKWQIPGGHVEKGEKQLNALKREVKEETDLEVVSIKSLLIRRFRASIYQVEVKGEAKVMEPAKVNTRWEYIEVKELKKKDTPPALSELLKKLTKTH